MQIKFKKLHPNAQAPFRKHNTDRGFDLTAVDIIADPQYQVFEVHSGLAFEFPGGIDAEIRSRSSIYKVGWSMCNGVGTIDHSYTGEVVAKFYVITGVGEYKVGDRFCQLVVPGVRPDEVEFVEVTELSTTERGEGGFGSTGK